MNMKQIRILPLVLLLGALLLAGGCAQDSTGPQKDVQAALKMSISGITADGISKFVLTVYDAETQETVVAGPVELTYSNGVVSGSINVPADQALLFVIEALGPNDEVLYRGSELGRVSERETLNLTIHMAPSLPMLWTTPVFFPAQIGQQFRVAVRVNEMPSLTQFEALWDYPDNLVLFDSAIMNQNVSGDIGFGTFDSGNGSILWYMDDYKPLTENTSPTDSITLGWMYFTVISEIGGRGKLAVRQINYAIDDQQADIVSQINTNSTDIDVSTQPTGRVPFVSIIDPTEAATVNETVAFQVQVIDDQAIDESEITLLYEGVAQPSKFVKIPQTANLYGFNFGVQLRQEQDLTFQILVTDEQ